MKATSDPSQTGNFWGTTNPGIVLCIAATLGLPVYGAGPAQDTPHAVYQPRAQMHLIGSYRNKNPLHSIKQDSFTLFSHIIVPDDNAPAGGTATFGRFDSGEIILMQYVEYLPSIQFAQTKRSVHPTKLPIKIDELPRYAMVCAWPLEDGKPPGSPIKAYAEREDANSEVIQKDQYIRINAVWRDVRATRAESKFSDKDYCTEIAQSKAAATAWWWPEPGK